METSFRDWEKAQRVQRQSKTRKTNTAHKSSRVLGAREKRRLCQLLLCMALFLVVFAGNGIFPGHMKTIRDTLRRVMESDTDFVQVFSQIGNSLSKGEPAVQVFGTLWTQAFGPAAEKGIGRDDNTIYQRELSYLTGEIGSESALEHWLRNPSCEKSGMVPVEPITQEKLVDRVSEPVLAPQETTAPPEELPVFEHIPYDGPELPENVTMDRYRLDTFGIEETVTPALGWVTSEFGWREHPVDGVTRFHNGVDLGMNTGTPIVSFADGTVDYIGESPIYGKYLQISHRGGVCSFYAHCSKLCVQKGQELTAGEKIAESGATGNATGPHLHFELKLNGTRLNPIYYIQTS